VIHFIHSRLSGNTKSMAASIFDSLKQDLKAGKVILPGDADYEDSIKRWSASCIQPAVSAGSLCRLT
jgi:hypothetical protein